MSNIQEEAYDRICNKIQNLVEILLNESSTLPDDKWNDIVKRIVDLNDSLENLRPK